MWGPARRHDRGRLCVPCKPQKRYGGIEENREKNIERLEDDELNLVLIDGDTKQVGPHRKIANALQSDMSARRNRVEGGLS